MSLIVFFPWGETGDLCFPMACMLQRPLNNQVVKIYRTLHCSFSFFLPSLLLQRLIFLDSDYFLLLLTFPFTTSTNLFHPQIFLPHSSRTPSRFWGAMLAKACVEATGKQSIWQKEMVSAPTLAIRMETGAETVVLGAEHWQ